MVSTGARFGARCLAFFPWFFVLVIVFLCCFAVKLPNNSGIIKVDQNIPKFDNSKDPVWLTHISDLHVAPHYEYSSERLGRVLKIFEKIVRPQFAVLSGDLTDNYGEVHAPSESNQQISHWMLYNETVIKSGISNDRLFEVFGNHDIWGLLTFDETSSYPAKYTHTKRDNFYAYQHFSKDSKTRVIGFVPQDFPTGHGPLQFCPAFTKAMIDQLEKVLKDDKGAENTFVSTHYTSELAFPYNTKSSSGKTFQDLLNEYKVIALLNGHTHPPYPQPRHTGKWMELTTTALKMFDAYSILVWDNNHLSYPFISNPKDNEDVAVLTYPSPEELAVANTADKSFDIRILSFEVSETPANKNFEAKIDGKPHGKLIYTREIEKGVHLYSLPVSDISDGKHSIDITGDLKYSIDFTVNANSGPFSETRKIDVTPCTGVVGTVLFYLLWIIYIVFMFLPSEKLDAAVSFIIGDSDEPQWLTLGLFGPAVCGRLLARQPIWYRIYLIVMIVWPLCLPCMLYQTEGKVSMLWSWGYVSNGVHMYDVFSQLITAVYLMAEIGVFVDIGLVISSGFMLPNIADAVLCAGLLAFSWWFWWQYGGDIGWPSYWGGSFLYFIFPCIAVFVYGFLAYMSLNKPTEQIDDDDKVQP